MGLFMVGSADTTMLPFRCCKMRIDMAMARVVLKPRDYEVFSQRMSEVQAVNKMYCTNKYCSQFIDLDTLSKTVSKYSCPKCDEVLCVHCRSAWHPGKSCPEHAAAVAETTTEDDGVFALAKQEGWRQCQQCHTMVELAHGCNHMTCRCGHHFCYACGASWLDVAGKIEQQCKCELWNEDNLLDEERRRVAMVQRVDRRVVLLAERDQIREQIQAGCQHGVWTYRDFGDWGLQEYCSNCEYFMPHYCFRCNHCSAMVCYTCRRHRLGGIEG